MLGIGRIGSASTRKGLGLGLNVIACDPYVPASRFTDIGARQVDFDTLCRESDYLTLHVPLTTETRRINDARALSLMKPTAFLINTARGDVVDIDALVEAVTAGTIAGAGIDVLPVEPPPPGEPALGWPNLVLQPHAAWYSPEASLAPYRRQIDDLARFLRGERPQGLIREVAPCG